MLSVSLQVFNVSGSGKKNSVVLSAIFLKHHCHNLGTDKEGCL